ncbi:hypothetical protein HFO56_03170 [Rhizobium laguerreae]|uniref:PcfJ domain-containing protein n=1 Tax=Rhizobium laguerreae TaxID=1076926 RepID=UPI001C8FB914|nr:PcfJ domain-containing protein [Rhizobium laguerreae]MBY3151388.1 hypothetical protein [Rhizobium laguerreae]
MTDHPIDDRPLHERVDSWLRGIACDDDVFQLLQLCFGRVILNRKIDDFTKLSAEVSSGCRWLRRSIEMKSGWLDRVDDLGRPKKLMKFSDIDGIMKEIRKSYGKEAQFFAQTVASNDDEEWFADLEDGFHLVRLKTRDAMLREGGVLQNCVGDGAYDQSLADGEYQYVVLRDVRNRSHAIAEIRTKDNLVYQFLGKQNAIPKDKYLLPFVKFMTDREWPIVNRWNNGLVIDDCGHVHRTHAAPENLCLRGDLWLSGCIDVVLPKALTVSGHLKISKSSISHPSDTMNVWALHVEDSSGPYLSDHLVVFEWLELKQDAVFPSIATTLVVGGSIIMSQNHHVQQMPYYLRVSDFLQAWETSFQEFGEDTQIKGLLDVHQNHRLRPFILDAERNVLYPGDVVEITSDLTGVNRRYHPGLEGQFGVVKSCFGSDGGYIMYAANSGLAEVKLIGRNLRKVAQTRNMPWRSGTVISEADTVYFDPFAKNPIPMEDDFFRNGGPVRGILDLQPLPEFMIEPVG